MPKYRAWHSFSCSNISSCDCHSLQPSKSRHLDTALASNEAFCPAEIISSRLPCKLPCCTSSLQGRDGDSVTHASHMILKRECISGAGFSCAHEFHLIIQEISPLSISSFGSVTCTKTFPHFFLQALSPPACFLFLLYLQGHKAASGRSGQGEMCFQRKMRFAQFP